ncbi:MAG: hypothetical protein IJV05_01270 [Muribaculaceae bacterium]|nr:hypothetical protein [Muribaculaceae bacterium]
MNINRFIDKYFNHEASISIEVFDDSNIYCVYKDIVEALNFYPEIELTVLQAMSYCFYEILDNVLTHSGKKMGTVLISYNHEVSMVKILVADDGMGIKNSLSQNQEYANIMEHDAIRICINDCVSDGKGMGYGLFSTMQLIKNAGIILRIHSGSHELQYDGKNVIIKQADYWQGTIVYFEIHSNKVINPNEVLGGRADAEGNYNEIFDENDSLKDLW